MASERLSPSQWVDAEREAIWRLWEERGDDVARPLDDPRVRRRIAELITWAVLKADQRDRERHIGH